jgi:anaerobic magnesium-protoporphyrin IX monomethyl ester cyclase
MKTLLLRPFVDSIGTIGITPPSSIMYLSSFLKSRNLEVKLIDKCVDRRTIGRFCLENPYIRNLFSEIKDYNPDIIGMTLFSRELSSIAFFCQLIKKEFKSSHLVLGGPHPTAMPKETMEQISECDFIIRGEGEITLYNLIHNISKNMPLHLVKGISFRDEETGEIFHCEDAAAVDNLDYFPFPDRVSLIENYRNNKYASLLYGIPSDIIITSRGCPYQCHFCFKVCRRYRSRSPENVIEEIRWIIKNISPQSIQIMDDSFTIERDRCLKILDYLIKERYPCRFKARSRVDAVDEELLKKMKKAGIDTIVYGFESGSQSMLDSFNKKTTLAQNIEVCKLTKKAGINCFGDMILFYPGENRKTLRQTKQFVKIARPMGLRFSILSPLPETKIYNQSKQSGSLISDWAVDRKLPWVKLEAFKDLAEMRKIAKRMFIKTLLNPLRILWVLKFFGRQFLRNPYFCLKMIKDSILINNSSMGEEQFNFDG